MTARAPWISSVRKYVALADPLPVRLAAGRVLLEYQTQPCRKLPTVREILRVANRSYQGTGRDWADPRNLLQLTRQRIGSMPTDCHD